MLKQLEEKLSYDGFFQSLSTLTEGTKEQYKAALTDFEKWSIDTEGKNLDQMMVELKNYNTKNQIKLLQNWINDSQSSGRTKRHRAGFVCKFLYYYDIDIDGRDFKTLKFGKMGKSFKKPFTIEIIKQIYNNSSHRRQVLYLFLISTGCRISEAMSLRRKDFDMTKKRIKVQIYQSKNDETRLGYLTKEAGRMISPILNKLDPNDFVFATMEDMKRAKNTEGQCFRRVTDQLGLGTDRRRSGIRHWTIHSFRSFLFTQYTKTHNGDLAHAYIGREQYLDSYLNMTEEEQLEQFIKVEPLLFINEALPETDTVINLREELEKVKQVKDDRLDRIEEELKKSQELNERNFDIMKLVSEGMITIKPDKKADFYIDNRKHNKFLKVEAKKKKKVVK